MFLSITEMCNRLISCEVALLIFILLLPLVLLFIERKICSSFNFLHGKLITIIFFCLFVCLPLHCYMFFSSYSYLLLLYLWISSSLHPVIGYRFHVGHFTHFLPAFIFYLSGYFHLESCQICCSSQ